MESLKILKKENLNWEYDKEADVLYISVGEPRPAEGIDIGEGVIVRIDPKTKEVVSLTIINFARRIFEEVKG